MDLDVAVWIKFVMMLESLCQHYGPQRLSEDMERLDGLRPGDNDDDEADRGGFHNNEIDKHPTVWDRQEIGETVRLGLC